MFRPSKCFVQFVAVETPNVSKGGIVVPDVFLKKGADDGRPIAVETPKRAKVVAVGPGKLTPAGFREVCCKPGDYIQLAPNAFIHGFMLNGELIHVVDDDFVTGTFDEEDVVDRPAQPEAEPEKKPGKVITLQ